MVKLIPSTGSMPNGPFRAERYVIQVQFGRVIHKLFQIHFRKTDGSMFVAFPYLPYKCDGMLSICTLPRGGEPADVCMESQGRITSHTVKYVHHPDGEAHFSQDGKIMTAVRKKSIPLADYCGHMFTIQIKGADRFPVQSLSRKTRKKRAKWVDLTLNLEENTPVAVKFCGFIHPLKQLIKKSMGNLFGFTTSITDCGKKRPAIIISPPDGRPLHNACLCLSYEPLDYLRCPGESCLTFIGGFDPPEITLDHSYETRFLSLAYPITDSDDVRERIGSVDLFPPEPNYGTEDGGEGDSGSGEVDSTDASGGSDDSDKSE